MSCIKTILDETINDPSLMKIGQWKAHVNATVNRVLNIHGYYGDPIVATIIGDGVFYTDNTYTEVLGKTSTLTTGNYNLYLGTGTYDIYFTNKNNITFICNAESGSPTWMAGNVVIDCRFLNKLDHFWEIDTNGVRFINTDYLDLSRYYNVRFYSAYLNMNVERFTETTAGVDRLIVSNDPTMYGDATELYKINFNDNALISCRNAEGATMTGTYDEFCDKAFANGKTSGRIRVHMPDDPTEDDPYLIEFTENGWTRL